MRVLIGAPAPTRRNSTPMPAMSPRTRLFCRSPPFVDHPSPVAPLPPIPAPVLIALPDGLSVSGVTTWALALARSLVQLDPRRRVMLLAHDEPPGQRPLAVPALPGVEIRRVRAPTHLRAAAGDLSPFIPPLRDALRSLAAPGGPPVVYIPTLLGDAFGLGAAISMTDPELLRVVGWQHADIPYDARVLAHYEPLLSRFAGVSARIAASLRDSLPSRAADIEHLANAVDVPDAPPERLPWPGRPLRLIYTGRLEHKQKRVLALVALSDELASRTIPHTLTLVGDGPAAEEVRALAATPSRARRLLLTGPLDPAMVRPLLRESDVFVLASRYEGLSISMLEAMAQGCIPVVSHVDSGAGEAIIDGLNGALVDIPADADDPAAARALADAIGHLARSSPGALAVEAWRTARDRFSLPQYAARAARIIDAAAASQARPWPASRPCAFTGAPSGPAGSGTVPPDAPQRLAALLARLAGRPVILHGAGRHTIELAATLATSPAPVVAITEDDPARWGTTLLGWPIINPLDAAATGARDVVISSWIHADQIFARRSVYERQGMHVHNLYRDAQEQQGFQSPPYSSSLCTS